MIKKIPYTTIQSTRGILEDHYLVAFDRKDVYSLGGSTVDENTRTLNLYYTLEEVRCNPDRDF